MYFAIVQDDAIFMGVYAAYMLLVHSSALVNIAITSIKRKKIAIVFNYLFLVDQFLGKSTSSAMYKNIRRGLFRLTGWVLLYLLIVTTSSMNFQSGCYVSIMTTLAEVISITINTLTAFQYITIVLSLNYRYNSLYDILKGIPDGSKKALTLNWNTGHVYSKTESIDSLRINVLRQQQVHLFDAISLADEVYGFPVLLHISAAVWDPCMMQSVH